MPERPDQAADPAGSQNLVVCMSTIRTVAPCRMTESRHTRMSSALAGSISAGAETIAALSTHSTG